MARPTWQPPRRSGAPGGGHSLQSGCQPLPRPSLLAGGSSALPQPHIKRALAAEAARRFRIAQHHRREIGRGSANAARPGAARRALPTRRMACSSSAAAPLPVMTSTWRYPFPCADLRKRLSAACASRWRMKCRSSRASTGSLPRSSCRAVCRFSASPRAAGAGFATGLGAGLGGGGASLVFCLGRGFGASAMGAARPFSSGRALRATRAQSSASVSSSVSRLPMGAA